MLYIEGPDSSKIQKVTLHKVVVLHCKLTLSRDEYSLVG
jgi:hypothetical protein